MLWECGQNSDASRGEEKRIFEIVKYTVVRAYWFERQLVDMVVVLDDRDLRVLKHTDISQKILN